MFFLLSCFTVHVYSNLIVLMIFYLFLILELSKSQNDLSMGAGHLTVVNALTQNTGRKSQSESAIDKACDVRADGFICSKNDLFNSVTM